MSPSTTTTVSPVSAMARARLSTAELLPSDSDGLTTATERSG
jgi:hypothetical protein